MAVGTGPAVPRGGTTSATLEAALGDHAPRERRVTASSPIVSIGYGRPHGDRKRDRIPGPWWAITTLFERVNHGDRKRDRIPAPYTFIRDIALQEREYDG